MLEFLEQVFWWALLLISAPVLVALVIAFPILCEREMMKEEK